MKVPCMGLSDWAVVRLACDLLEKGAFHSSCNISPFKKNLYTCSTARANCKHLPTSVTQKKLKRSEMTSAVRKEIKVFNWKDKRNVLTVSRVPEHDECLAVTGERLVNE